MIRIVSDSGISNSLIAKPKLMLEISKIFGTSEKKEEKERDNVHENEKIDPRGKVENTMRRKDLGPEREGKQIERGKDGSQKEIYFASTRKAIGIGRKGGSEIGKIIAENDEGDQHKDWNALDRKRSHKEIVKQVGVESNGIRN